MKRAKAIKKLKNLKQIYNYRMAPSNRKDHFEYAIPVEGHRGQLFLVSNLLKVCILALDKGQYGNDKQIPTPEFNISEVLRLALEFLPHEQMEYLEEAEKLFQKL
uniref:hypothetical protein n=1 Tax=uncultured Christiangramia sp. TaxID=503836 RepID=UPI00261B028A|nr:hypothetical protein [uncultured Christiangramia sp.]